MTTAPASFSCSLSAPDLDERARAWRALADQIVRRERTEGGFRVVFDHRALGEVAALAGAERSCCGWATWSVTSEPSLAVLEVTGPAEPVGALAAAFGL